MTGQLKLTLVGAAAIACVFGMTMPSQALTCQRGSFTTPQCFQALEKQMGQAAELESCLKQMEAAASSSTGSAGSTVDADKHKCGRLITDLSQGVNLDDTSSKEADVNSAIKAVKSWADH